MERPPEKEKKKKQQLPLIRNTRLTKSLDARVEEYLQKNNLSYNMLVRLALEEFISVERTWKLEPVARKEPVKANLFSLYEHKRKKGVDEESFDSWLAKMGATIQVKTKAVTGRVRYYPIGENAKHVRELTKKKTLSELDIEALKALGCHIEKVPGDPDDRDR